MTKPFAAVPIDRPEGVPDPPILVYGRGFQRSGVLFAIEHDDGRLTQLGVTREHGDAWSVTVPPAYARHRCIVYEVRGNPLRGHLVTRRKLGRPGSVKRIDAPASAEAAA